MDQNFELLVKKEVVCLEFCSDATVAEILTFGIFLLRNGPCVWIQDPS